MLLLGLIVQTAMHHRRTAVTMLKKSTKQVPSSQAVRTTAEDRYRGQRLPEVLYQSVNYTVINKGFDIKINSDDPDEMTVQQQLLHLVPEHASSKVAHQYRFAHRLDFATSGVLCVALNKKAAARFVEQFKRKEVIKHYLALVRGHVKDEITYIDVPTGKMDLPDDPTWNRCCTAYDERCLKSLPTQTLVICLERGHFNGEPASKLLLKPFTGRTHQLRVHCDHIGHTIVGDFTYSLRQDTAPERMMLHAYSLQTSTATENIDVTTTDPFTSEFEPSWCGNDRVFTIDEARNVTDKFNQNDPNSSNHDCIKDRLKVLEFNPDSSSECS